MKVGDIQLKVHVDTSELDLAFARARGAVLEIENRMLRAILEAARHELAAHHGLWATDRPELFEQEKFQIDMSAVIDRIDRAMPLVPIANQEAD